MFNNRRRDGDDLDHAYPEEQHDHGPRLYALVVRLEDSDGLEDISRQAHEGWHDES